MPVKHRQATPLEYHGTCQEFLETFKGLGLSQQLPFAPKGDACGHGITSSITADIATHIAYSIGHSITTETILSCRFQYHQCLNIVILLLLKSSFLLMTPSMKLIMNNNLLRHQHFLLVLLCRLSELHNIHNTHNQYETANDG